MQATQKPKANSRKAQAANTKANTKAKIVAPKNKLMTIRVENKMPIRAENNLGPALTICLLKFNVAKIYLDTIANGLYFDNSSPRRVKSIRSSITGKIDPLTK